MSATSALLSQNLSLLAIFGHAVLLGEVLSTRWGLWTSTANDNGRAALRLFFSACAGLAVQITSLFLLALVGQLRPIPVLTLAGLSALLAVVALVRQGEWRLGLVRGLSQPRLWLWLLAFVGLWLALSMYSVRVPGHWDDTEYHLPVARFYLETGGLGLQPYLRFPLFPHDMHLLLALGMMFGGDVLAQGMVTMPLFLMALGMVGASRAWWGSAWPALGGVALLLSFNAVTGTLGYAYIDCGLALFCWACLLAMARDLEAPGANTRWLWMAGLMGGMALGTKLFGLPLVGLCGLWLLGQRRWKDAVTFGLWVLAFGLWWYVRSAWISGDPIHPAGGNLFGHYLWNAGDLAGQIEQQRTYGVPRDPLLVATALVNAKAAWWQLGLLSVFFIRRERASVRFVQFVFAAYIAFWFFASQVDRYLAPVFALGSLLSVWFIVRCVGAIPALARLWPRLHSVQVWAAPVLALALVVPYAQDAWVKTLDWRNNWDVYLGRIRGYAVMAKANALAPTYGHRLLQMGYENATHFYQGRVIGDWFGPGRYTVVYVDNYDTRHIRGPQELKAIMNRFGTRLFALNRERAHVNLADYAQDFDILMDENKDVLMAPKDPTVGASPVSDVYPR